MGVGDSERDRIVGGSRRGGILPDEQVRGARPVGMPGVGGSVANPLRTWKRVAVDPFPGMQSQSREPYALATLPESQREGLGDWTLGGMWRMEGSSAGLGLEPSLQTGNTAAQDGLAGRVAADEGSYSKRNRTDSGFFPAVSRHDLGLAAAEDRRQGETGNIGATLGTNLSLMGISNKFDTFLNFGARTRAGAHGCSGAHGAGSSGGYGGTMLDLGLALGQSSQGGSDSGFKATEDTSCIESDSSPSHSWQLSEGSGRPAAESLDSGGAPPAPPGAGSPALRDSKEFVDGPKLRICWIATCTNRAKGPSGLCVRHGGGKRCQTGGCSRGAEGSTGICKGHGGGKRCEHASCPKSAEGRTGLCIAHGGGRRCGQQGCPKAARGGTSHCIRHGGGRRCMVDGCTKSAEGLWGKCILHGGGRRCCIEGCPKAGQGGTGACKAHGGGRRCTTEGCTKGAEGKEERGLCKAHGGGRRCEFGGGGICGTCVHSGTRFCVTHGGGKRCQFEGCGKSARGKTDFCVRHGGGKRCTAPGCTKSAQGNKEHCKTHGGGTTPQRKGNQVAPEPSGSDFIVPPSSSSSLYKHTFMGGGGGGMELGVGESVPSRWQDEERCMRGGGGAGKALHLPPPCPTGDASVQRLTLPIPTTSIWREDHTEDQAPSEYTPRQVAEPHPLSPGPVLQPPFHHPASGSGFSTSADSAFISFQHSDNTSHSSHPLHPPPSHSLLLPSITPHTPWLSLPLTPPTDPPPHPPSASSPWSEPQTPTPLPASPMFSQPPPPWISHLPYPFLLPPSPHPPFLLPPGFLVPVPRPSLPAGHVGQVAVLPSPHTPTPSAFREREAEGMQARDGAGLGGLSLPHADTRKVSGHSGLRPGPKAKATSTLRMPNVRGPGRGRKEGRPPLPPRKTAGGACHEAGGAGPSAAPKSCISQTLSLTPASFFAPSSSSQAGMRGAGRGDGGVIYSPGGVGAGGAEGRVHGGVMMRGLQGELGGGARWDDE